MLLHGRSSILRQPSTATEVPEENVRQTVPNTCCCSLFTLHLQMLMNSGPKAQEISFQEFKTQLLARGQVGRLEVVNGNTVRVYARGSPSGSPAGIAVAGGAPGAAATAGSKVSSEELISAGTSGEGALWQLGRAELTWEAGVGCMKCGWGCGKRRSAGSVQLTF